ncbi:MAG: YqeG family HAD IIIA-type phosphatase [Oscillospiraceae bacterium]|nr:YqeG family HAD IIIA-type phosphatase [Oscillospiraceae bacterium]
MPFSLLPRLVTDRVTDLSPRLLRDHGIRLLMLDFDNTLVPYTTDEPTDAVADWLKAILQSDILLCVVSNSRNDRVKKFCRRYGIDCITHARKPFSKGIRQCLQKYGLPAGECALVGDQIYTDVMGANGCGVVPILVKAIHNHNFWLKARHVAELPFVFAARNRRIDHEKY